MNSNRRFPPPWSVEERAEESVQFALNDCELYLAAKPNAHGIVARLVGSLADLN
jgi:hypothetical protein